METTRSNTEVEAAAALGAARVPADQRVVKLDDGEGGPVVVLVLRDQGQAWELQAASMEHLERNRKSPRARTNHPTIRELKSFEAYVNRYKGEHSVIFADDVKSRIVAVFDYHPAGGDQRDAGWGRHRAVYECPHDPAWLAWAAVDGKVMSQDDLALFLDEHSGDLVESSAPGMAAPSDLVTLTRNLHIVSKGTFTRNVNETTGEYELVSKREHIEKSTPIPKGFYIGVPIYIGGDRFPFEVRLRFRVAEDRPSFTLSIQRKAETLLKAFTDVYTAAGDGSDLPVFVGSHNL
jgi:uncharacterized protein YfdQ (DUF2303 family)